MSKKPLVYATGVVVLTALAASSFCSNQEPVKEVELCSKDGVAQIFKAKVGGSVYPVSEVRAPVVERAEAGTTLTLPELRGQIYDEAVGLADSIDDLDFMIHSSHQTADGSYTSREDDKQYVPVTRVHGQEFPSDLDIQGIQFTLNRMKSTLSANPTWARAIPHDEALAMVGDYEKSVNFLMSNITFYKHANDKVRPQACEPAEQ